MRPGERVRTEYNMPHMRWAYAVGAILFASTFLASVEAKAKRDIQVSQAEDVQLAQKPAPTSPKKPSQPQKEEPEAERKPASESECAWVGKRITGLLARDDVQAASEFLRFYSSFDCPVQHLGKAFGCVVSGADVSAEAAGDRVDRCWFDPTTRVFPPRSDAPAKPKNNEKGQTPK